MDVVLRLLGLHNARMRRVGQDVRVCRGEMATQIPRVQDVRELGPAVLSHRAKVLVQVFQTSEL